MAQLVEHNLAKVGVAGSSPVVRSIACIGPVFESALFIPTAKWPSGKAEACKAFTPGSNPGFASRPPRGPPEGGPLFVHGTRARAAPAARCGGVSRCGGRGRGAFPRARRPARIRALFQMEQEIPFGAGPRRSKGDFLLHLGSSGDGLSHLISTIFEKLLAPARGIAYIDNPQADMAQLVEHNLAKVGVAGSSPVVRSIACIGPVFESALFIPTAKWPSGKAEACKAFTPGSNPGFASRPPRGPPEGGPLFVHGTRARAAPAARCGGVSRCGGRGRGAFPRARRPARIRALFQMEQEIPFGAGPRRSKGDFLLHLGLEPLLRVRLLSRLLGVVAIGQGIVCPLCINCAIFNIRGLVIHC